MTESKIELTERLRREGRWSEASLFKDETLRKLRSDGMTKADAGEEAWRRMAAKFPPLADTGKPTPDAPDAAGAESLPPQRPGGTEPDIEAMLDETDDGLPVDLVQDVLWCYSNMNRRVGPEDAPSGGAWGLLCWSRKYQIKFYEALLPKALANRPPQDEENIRAEKKSIAEVRGILQKFKDAGEAELQRDLLANVPATIQAGVRSRLTDWAKHFALNLADDARVGLEARICGFIQDCAKTIGRTPGGIQ